MEKSLAKIELNRQARRWLYENRRDLLLREDTTILSARPHIFRVRRGGVVHVYDRWTWNIHVHGKDRKEETDFVLLQMDQAGQFMAVYYVPHDVAIKRKSIALYQSRNPRRVQYVRNWLSRFELDLTSSP